MDDSDRRMTAHERAKQLGLLRRRGRTVLRHPPAGVPRHGGS
jgi:hypothetical protein